MKLFLCLIIPMLLVSCSDSDKSEQADTTKAHVWQEQTDMIDKANQVEGMLNAAALKQKQQIDAATAD